MGTTGKTDKTRKSDDTLTAPEDPDTTPVRTDAPDPDREPDPDRLNEPKTNPDPNETDEPTPDTVEPGEVDPDSPIDTPVEPIPAPEDANSESNSASSSEYKSLYDDPNLTPEKLNEKLNEYAAAYQAEFEMSAKADTTNQDTEKLTRDFFKKNAAASAAQIVWLSNNADSETVRLNASKTVLVMAFEDAKNDGDPFKELLNGLTSNKRAERMPAFVPNA